MVKIGRGERCRIKTGTYAGDGAATQAITGVGFQPKTIIIYHQTPARLQGYGVKTDQDGANALYLDMALGGIRYVTDMIISLDPDGFTVGDGTGNANYFNINTITYTFIAWG